MNEQHPSPATAAPLPSIERAFAWLHMSPAVLHAQPSKAGTFRITANTRILVDDPARLPLGQRLANACKASANLPHTPTVIVGVTPQAGDIRIGTGAVDGGDVGIPEKGMVELYRLDITDRIVVTGISERALARAATTLHKALMLSPVLIGAVVIDAPRYAERSVLLDAGRKYFSPAWVKNLIREMAWNQINTLHLHMTDNEGVRVVFPSAPDVASPDAWTPQELNDILATAKAYHIEVIPELEAPGHMDWILRNRPQFQLRLSSGQVVSKALDFSIPAAREFLKELVRDTLAMFPDCRHVHLGADEYFLSPITAHNTPQLQRYVREQSGKPDADSVDAVRHFVNDLASLVRNAGKVARVWNDNAVSKNPLVALSREHEIECWSIWGSTRNEANVQELVNAGYRVKNAHGDFYFIIRPGWDNLDHPMHSPNGLYDVWRANRFMDKAGAAFTEIPADSPNMVGAGIQVWADDPGYWSPEEVWRQLVKWMLPLGQRTWDSPHAAPSYAQLSPIAREAAHPPAEY